MTISPFTFVPTTRVAFGVDRARKVGDDVAAIAGRGAKVLLVADPGVMAAGIGDAVLAALEGGGCATTVFSDIRSDPLGSQVDAAAERARSAGVACVVGLGGGSTLDVAKLAA